VAANAATILVSFLGSLLLISIEEQGIASESLKTEQPIGHIVECNDDADIKKLELSNLRIRLTEYLPLNETLTVINYTLKDAVSDEKRLHYISLGRTLSSAFSIFASLDILTHSYELNFCMRLLALIVTTALFTPKIYKGYSCLFKAGIDSYSSYRPQSQYTGLFFSRKLEDLEIDMVSQDHTLQSTRAAI